MPEGPSIVIVKEALQEFEGKKVMEAAGNAKIDMERLRGEKIVALKTWGKHFLICFKGFTVRIHFLMFGTYRINERMARKLRFGMTFSDGSELNFYTTAVRLLDGSVNSNYDWTADIMNNKWSPAKAKEKLEAVPYMMACDALLDQNIFSGVGNIIKNEVLYRIKVHPESLVGKMPAKKITEMINESRVYTFEFLVQKKNNELKKHWLAYTKKKCKRCDLPMIKEYTGLGKRRSFFCTNCQKLYI